MAGKSKYNREFKLAIIAQIDAGESVTQVARENGLSPTLVARWKREYKQNPEKAFAGPGHPYNDQARLAEMERLCGKLYAENEFLKKTIERPKQYRRRYCRHWNRAEVRDNCDFVPVPMFRETAGEEGGKSQYYPAEQGVGGGLHVHIARTTGL